MRSIQSFEEICKSHKNRQHNDQKKNDNNKNNGQQNTAQNKNGNGICKLVLDLQLSAIGNFGITT
jgi:hypothetical protein